MELRSAGGKAGRFEQRGGSRARRPGSPRRLYVAVAAALLGTAAAVSLSLGGGTARPALQYGGLPSWIPRAKMPVDRIVDASPAHRWLAIEGDTVAVRLASGGALVTAVGPDVPGKDVATDPLKTVVPCTFVVTFARPRGVIALKARDFALLDEQGQLVHPRVLLLNSGRPQALRGGSGPVSLRVVAVLPVGSGTLQWSPLPGKPLVAWDFDVEVD